MKSLLLPVLLFVTNALAVSEVPREIRKEWVVLVEPYVSTCECETHILPEKAYRMFRYSEYCNTGCNKCYIRCIYLALNLMNSATGELNEGEFVRQMAGVTEEIAEECNQKAYYSEDQCEKAYIMMKCIVNDLAVKIW